MTRFSGKTAIVTGGASGIGLAVTRRLAAEGAGVVIADRAIDTARTVAEELSAQGLKVAAFEMDVTKSDNWAEAVDFAENTFGKLNVVVNSAGYPQPYRPAHEEPEDSYDRLYDVNVKSLYWCTLHAIQRMIANGGGAVVNVCSVSAVRPRPLNAWYGPSKAAAVTTTQALAIEYAKQNIRVCGVNPGPVDTPLLSESLSGWGGHNEQVEARGRMMEALPMGRVGQPEEIANAVVFLASDEASFITGEVINVDGGRSV